MIEVKYSTTDFKTVLEMKEWASTHCFSFNDTVAVDMNKGFTATFTFDNDDDATLFKLTWL